MKEISLHILDILQNSVAASAKRIELEICEDAQSDLLTIRITDDGCGISREKLQSVLDPFTTSRTTRKVGMGLPMFKASAEQAGGSLGITSAVGQGTQVTATYRLTHIDRPPLGDLPGTVLAQVMGSPNIRFVCRYQAGDAVFEFDTHLIQQELGPEVPITHPAVTQWMKEYLSEGIRSINGGA